MLKQGWLSQTLEEVEREVASWPEWMRREARRDYTQPEATMNFQAQVKYWIVACFGEQIANDKVERNQRFTEEALELVQACGATAEDCHKLVDYVFSRPVGDKFQEVGGVMTTLNSLALAHGIDTEEAGEAALKHVWANIDKIRQKQANKPKNSPLPE